METNFNETEKKVMNTGVVLIAGGVVAKILDSLTGSGSSWPSMFIKLGGFLIGSLAAKKLIDNSNKNVMKKS